MDFFNFDIAEIIKTLGYVGLFAVIFAESGLFFGFFLPGGSLLFTAGLLASQGFFNIYILVVILGTAAILGDSVGYWFGSKVGPRIFNKDDSLFFHKKHLERTRVFYEKYGPRAVISARFIPIFRTFIPILAGVGKMNYSKFLRNNILGGILWSIGISLLGYFLGGIVPGIEQYLIYIIAFIIFLSVLPILFEVWKKLREPKNT